MKNIALILAAGKGTRLKSDSSKILTKVNNKTLIDHSIDKGKIVLIDVFEITSNKEKVLKQLKKRSWAKPDNYKKHLSNKKVDHLIKKLDKTFTKRNLEKHWKTK